jgi:sigma-54 dependent transcriptional regulator, acetoin dehydrogenase operon transcriptional activator AcoR
MGPFSGEGFMDGRHIHLLFLSAENACRSQMAEGFARAQARPGITVQSAGARAGAVHPLAIQVMAEAGVDIRSQTTKTLDTLPAGDFDMVVSLDRPADGASAMLPGNPAHVCWEVAAPASEDIAAFRALRDDIRPRVDELLGKGYLEALAHVKQYADLVLDHVSDGVIAHDLERRILYFNAAAERITGFAREAVLNRDCHEVLAGGLCGGKCSFCEGQPLPAEGEMRELDICTRQGERRRVGMTLHYLDNQQGRRVGIVVCFRDVTRELRLARRLGEIEHFAGIIGRDPKMLALFDLIPELAESNAPVLIQGESGTGKELIAAALHNEGPRAGKLFVPVNCGALPEGLLESELFGHVRGAFTGAVRDKKGRFELADGGTIFLDEIGDISPAMQVKLLRVLQEGCFEPVGGEKTRRINVRVISATNKELTREMAAGRFREDLFYRLGVIPLTVPPLRDRPTDIPLIASHFLERAVREAGRQGVSFSDEAISLMVSYSWPGNVRELQNWIQFALIKCKSGPIRLEHLPPVALQAMRPAPAPGDPAGDALTAIGRARVKLNAIAVRDALERTGGNRVAAARFLGVSRATLYRFLDSQSAS